MFVVFVFRGKVTFFTSEKNYRGQYADHFDTHVCRQATSTQQKSKKFAVAELTVGGATICHFCTRLFSEAQILMVLNF